MSDELDILNGYSEKKRMFDTIDYYSLVIILESSKFRELQMTLFQDCDIFSLHVGIKVRVRFWKNGLDAASITLCASIC